MGAIRHVVWGLNGKCPAVGPDLSLSLGKIRRQQMTQETAIFTPILRQIERNVPAVLEQDLPPRLRERLESLLGHLSANDTSMALLDLAQLYRGLTADGAESLGGAGASTEAKAPTWVRTLIYGKDDATIEDICLGPRPDGTCARSRPGASVDCADHRISAMGWDFKVAPDAKLCPLTSMGIIRFLSRQQSPIGS